MKCGSKPVQYRQWILHQSGIKPWVDALIGLITAAQYTKMSAYSVR
jgi:hypothetical protein